MTKEGKVCYICPSNKYIEGHHLDCKHGELSPETVPLCKRCHRTYHDLGVEWFDDEFLDRAIEIENRRRQIVYVEPLILLRREDVRRSGYFNKAHGIKPTKQKATFSRQGIEPLPGWEWYFEHHNDPPPPWEMVIYCDGKKVAEVTDSLKRGEVRRIMRNFNGSK